MFRYFIKKLFSSKNEFNLSDRLRKYYKNKSDKEIVQLIIESSEEKLVKYLTGLLIKRTKTKELEFEITRGLEVSFQSESDKVKTFEYVIEAKTILASTLYKNGRVIMINNYKKYLENCSHWDSEIEIMSSYTLNEHEVINCLNIAIDNYKKRINDFKTGEEALIFFN